jgi:rare lipoprotein A
MKRGIVLALLAAMAFGLTGCGSVSQLPPVSDASVPQPSGAARRTPALPPAGSGRGGYYQDDGPGDSAPPDLQNTPDAVPKIEPYSRTGNRPYVVFGVTYTPITDERPLKQRGRGSWYGKKFHGQKTSSGEIYDMYKMTAAHPTLPIPSYARVTNLSNGNRVVVRVNDRGPFHSSRIIDLSYTAALKLGYIGKGSTDLEVERILPEEIARMAAAPAPSAPVATTPVAEPVAAPVIERVAAEAAAQNNTPAAVPVAQRPASAGGFYLQLGAFGQQANAEAARSRLVQGWGNLPPPEVVQSGSLYRLHSGPFATRGEADAAARQVRDAGIATPVVVQR